MLRRTSLYTALVVALLTTILLMAYVFLEFIPYESNNEALLIRAPRLSTTSWAVFDSKTGDVLYGNKVDDTRPIASVTKLFTAYMVFFTESTSTVTTVTEDDIKTEGEFGKLKAGETRTLGSLLFPLLIESSNDAGTAIARALGPLYTDALTGVLTRLGLTRTKIVDPTGLSKDDVSTPRELAKFFVKVRGDYPHITDITQLRMYIEGKRGLVNNNPARNLPNFTGGKQGYTPEAGKTFVGTFKLPKGEKEVGLVILGSTDLPADISRLLGVLR